MFGFLQELLGSLLYDIYARAEVETAGCLWEWFRSPRRAILTVATLTFFGLGLYSLFTHGPLVVSLLYCAAGCLTIALSVLLAWRTFVREERQRAGRGMRVDRRERPRIPRQRR